ncbi:carbohydrate kinase family protein [Thalassospira alkalitolerans]|uniref:carbohydrate kinase family protein n=1 Tax=Thalassospira alkalitolerans TaxID=1293890 RepID=UPI003AA8A58C
MIKPSANILCLGAAHFDRTLQCTETFVPAASNPVRTLHHKPGGVSRNIAVHLRLLGCNVAILSAVGDDGDGDQIVQSLSELGIDTRQIRKIPGGHTAGYTAILDETGELALGLMDAEVYDRLTPDFLAGQLGNLRCWPWWMVDVNLPMETLDWLADQKQTSKFCAATVSPSKAARLKPVLGRIDLLIANRAETKVLTGIEINEISDAPKAVMALRQHGINHMVITLGAMGVVSADDTEMAFWRPLPTKVVDVNGAGDAFYAGFLSTFRKPGAAFDDAIATGLAMASLTAETQGTTVWNLDLKSVRKRALTAAKETI